MNRHELVVVAGEVTCAHRVDYERIVREAICDIGYTDPTEPFCAETVQILIAVTRQSTEIGAAVDGAGLDSGSQGAGDQGIMFGYVSGETKERMPLPILLAHRLTKGLADDRHAGTVPWLRPDAKAQVSVVYERNEPAFVSHVLVSTQHTTAEPWANTYQASTKTATRDTVPDTHRQAEARSHRTQARLTG